MQIDVNRLSVGYAPSKLGRYRLSTSMEKVLLRSFSLSIIDPQGVSPTMVEMASVRKVTALETDSVFFMDVPNLQIDVINPFANASLAPDRENDFLTDIQTYCKKVAFCPHIETGGNWEFGFDLDMAGAQEAERKEFFMRLLPHAPQTMFLNLYWDDKSEINGSLFHQAVSWLLGRMKVEQLSAQKGLALSANAFDSYAALYQGSFFRGLRSYFMTNPEFIANFSMQKNLNDRIGDIEEGGSVLLRRLDSRERGLVVGFL